MKLQLFLYKLPLSLIFFYFGVLALINPVEQGEIWIQEPFFSIITSVFSLTTFMIVFAVIEITVSILLLIGFYTRIVAGIMFVLLLGIIINLGIYLGFLNDVVMRDIALAILSLSLIINTKL